MIFTPVSKETGQNPETERPLSEVVNYADGSSNLEITKPGTDVNLGIDSKDKYISLTGPSNVVGVWGDFKDGTQKTYIFTESGYGLSVVIDTDAAGRTTESVGDFDDPFIESILNKPVTVGRESDRFDGMTVRKIGAAYKVGGEPSANAIQGPNPISTALRLIDEHYAVN